MSETTNLKLFKHDNPSTNNNQFNVENALNKNWDKIDEFAGETKEQLDSLQQGKEVLENKVETLETDNETNKLDIVELQQESSDLEDYISNILPSGQASGEDITINDSAKYPCVVEVSGNSWQETREGYNLLNVDKEFTVNRSSAVMNLALEPATYTIKFDDVETSDSNVTSYVCLFLLDDTEVAYLHITKAEKKKTFTLKSTTNKFRIWSADSNGESAGVTTTYKNLMIYAGNENKEYEEYGASPSTKYPSNLQAIGDSGSLKITDSNKNLCYESRVQNSDNVRFYFNPRLLEKTFTISFIVDVDLSLNSLYLSGVNENPRVSQITAAANTKAVQTITLTDEIYNELKNVKAPYFLLYKSNAGFTEVKEAMIVNGTDTSETYIAHEEQNVTFPFAEGQKLLKNGKLGDTEIIQNRKRFALDGTESWFLSTLNNYQWFGLNKTGIKVGSEFMCSHLKNYERIGNYEGIANHNTANRVYVAIAEITTVEQLKTYLSEQNSAGTPITIEYDLAEPETVAYTEAQKTAKAEIDKLKTYKGVTYITTDSKAILDVSYKKDLEILINNINNAIVEGS